MSRFVLTATGSVRRPDMQEVRRALSILADPDKGCEIRSLPSGRSAVRRGSDLDGLCKAVEDMADGTGTYFALNPIPLTEERATVGNVLCRRWFLIDLDPLRAEPDSNATEEEKEAARAVANAIMRHFSSVGWPTPLLVDSGNGWHLLYRIDMDNDNHAKAVLKKLLYDLADRFDTNTVKVDRKVHNAGRISKLPGTWARKGPHSVERPHRLAKLVYVPDEMIVVPTTLLGTLPGTDGASLETATSGSSGAFVLTATNGAGAAYAKQALQNECAAVALAAEHHRNDTLNKAAFSLGQFVPLGLLTESEIEGRLYFAAQRAGLEESEIRKTIRSGMEAGKLLPRTIPERKEKKGKAEAGGSAADAVPAGESIIVRASAIEPRKVEWLWPGRIPLGKLTTFAGQGGLGKTFVLCDITARVTRGLDWPDSAGECCEQGQVLFVSGEDDPDDTLVPRMIELGADLNRIAFLKTEVQDRFTLADLKTLDRALAEIGPDVRFIAIDPPAAFLGDVDDHRNAEVRSLLSPLKSWAARHRLAIVFNTHFTKSGGAKVEAMQRVMASVAWVNAVRAAHAFATDPEDPERVLFLTMKMNLARKRKGLAYRIVDKGDLASVEWLGEVDLTADQAVNREPGTPRQKLAADWLVELFQEKLEWSSEDFWASAKENGVSKRSIDEARVKLDMPKPRLGYTLDGVKTWTWWVPEDWPPLLEQDGGIEQKGSEEESF